MLYKRFVFAEMYDHQDLQRLIAVFLPGKHKKLYNIFAMLTLGRRCINVIQMFCVYWVVLFMIIRIKKFIIWLLYFEFVNKKSNV